MNVKQILYNSNLLSQQHMGLDPDLYKLINK